jgi:hypothetical protein
MMRLTFRFPCQGEIIESYSIIATLEEWAELPESEDPCWSVWRDTSHVFANSLALPTRLFDEAQGDEERADA